MHRWLLLLPLVACAPKSPTASEPPAAESTTDQPSEPAATEPVLDMPDVSHDPATVAQMHTWLQLAEAARSQLTAGDLDAARASAASMAASPSPADIPASWRPFAADLLAEATALASAETPQAAGGHLGRMALACGTCHTEAGVVEQVAMVVLPEEMNDNDARMDNHQWASDWMWFGLVTADARFYRLGAATFSGPGLPRPTDAVSGTEMRTLLEQVGRIAKFAEGAGDDEERASNYGELLAACATCHAMAAAE